MGHEYEQPHPYVAAGAVGTFLVALDALFAWFISQRRVQFVMLITGAGSIGGLVFQLLDAVFKMNERGRKAGFDDGLPAQCDLVRLR